jgi:hypothetical protein
MPLSGIQYGAPSKVQCGIDCIANFTVCCAAMMLFGPSLLHA